MALIDISRAAYRRPFSASTAKRYRVYEYSGGGCALRTPRIPLRRPFGRGGNVRDTGGGVRLPPGAALRAQTLSVWPVGSAGHGFSESLLLREVPIKGTRTNACVLWRVFTYPGFPPP